MSGAHALPPPCALNCAARDFARAGADIGYGDAKCRNMRDDAELTVRVFNDRAPEESKEQAVGGATFRLAGVCDGAPHDLTAQLAPGAGTIDLSVVYEPYTEDTLDGILPQASETHPAPVTAQ